MIRCRWPLQPLPKLHSTPHRSKQRNVQQILPNLTLLYCPLFQQPLASLAMVAPAYIPIPALCPLRYSCLPKHPTFRGTKVFVSQTGLAWGHSSLLPHNLRFLGQWLSTCRELQPSSCFSDTRSKMRQVLSCMLFHEFCNNQPAQTLILASGLYPSKQPTVCNTSLSVAA